LNVSSAKNATNTTRCTQPVFHTAPGRSSQSPLDLDRDTTARLPAVMSTRGKTDASRSKYLFPNPAPWRDHME
jgi:hypothetical protein